MKNFSGNVLFLDRSDINTDEIIPAKYLSEISKRALAPHLLEDLRLPGFNPGEDIMGKNVIVTRENFGCGSSREHAPWALEMNDINLVIAVSFARIFKQNMFNCGMMAVELPEETITHIFSNFKSNETTVTTDLKNSTFTIEAGARKEAVVFSISDFHRDLVKAGGWVDYADRNY